MNSCRGPPGGQEPRELLRAHLRPLGFSHIARTDLSPPLAAPMTSASAAIADVSMSYEQPSARHPDRHAWLERGLTVTMPSAGARIIVLSSRRSRTASVAAAA
jgi:hypothetical protein